MSHNAFSRRAFLRRSFTFAVAAPVGFRSFLSLGSAPGNAPSGQHASSTAVAVVGCKSYTPAEVRSAFDRAFDLLAGIGDLVRNKTVAVKLNLTGTNFSNYLGRPVGETFMTHPASVHALCAALFANGARRVRFLESTNSRGSLESTLSLADWDTRAMTAMGKVEFENTRNLGNGRSYAHLPVTGGGYMFSAFDLNHSYEDTDVMVSFAKLKNHVTAGVTLSMKNLFGITPNALYGDEAGNEQATGGRGPLHDHTPFPSVKLPGIKEGVQQRDATWRVPRIIADLCAARPIHLAIIDGIASVSGGEGPWCDELKPISPGVLIAGFNPVSTDAVGTALMGYSNPRGSRGTKPFHFCDNHLLLAEQKGVGTADLKKIDLRGLAIDKARARYAWL